jgi:hypothetical protein
MESRSPDLRKSPKVPLGSIAPVLNHMRYVVRRWPVCSGWDCSCWLRLTDEIHAYLYNPKSEAQEMTADCPPLAPAFDPSTDARGSLVLLQGFSGSPALAHRTTHPP